jgi:hypothetical protein
MLVENKFLFVSLPRCASFSFYISCIRHGFEINHFNQKRYDESAHFIDLSMNNEELADHIFHVHEKSSELINKFGNKYDIISIKRNRYERFISVWKHTIDMVEMERLRYRYPIELVNILKKLNLDDILFFKTFDLISHESEKLVFIEFCKRNGIEKYVDDYFINMLQIAFRPTSYWHNNNPKIKYFDFGNFTELEDWVSNKTNKPFKMEKSNGSQHFECKLKLNDEFIKRYNDIYDYYDIQKNNKTLI